VGSAPSARRSFVEFALMTGASRRLSVLTAAHWSCKLGQLKIRCSNEGCGQIMVPEQLTQHEKGSAASD
jgi:hypothetical protein